MKRILCWITGHPIELTGVKTVSLHQVVCIRCKQLFVKCEGQRGMLPWTVDWEIEFTTLQRGG